MSYNPTTRSREYKEGWLGRRRTYHCTECNDKFQVDTLHSLPKIDRVCPVCRLITSAYTFVNKRGKEVLVRASNAELATLRAWNKDHTLTFKVPQMIKQF